MEETEHCPVQQPLRQGDILRIESSGSSQRPFSLAAIINADCDMANEKHDGVIAVLPIYHFPEYLKIFWLPTFVGGHMKSTSKTIQNLCKLEEENVQELIRWIKSPSDRLKFDLDKFAESFKFGKKESTSLVEALGRLKITIDSQESMSLGCIGRLAPNPENCDKYIKDQVLEAKKGLGDGHFFVTDVKGDDGIGFVIRMRRIYSIDANRCFPSYSAYQANTNGQKDGAFRLSRLTPHYKFKLAQIFAQQYSRIGLPDELMALSTLAVDNVVQHIKALNK